MISRRGIIGGLAGLIAAPAIVKAGSLMPISSAFMKTADLSPVIEVECGFPDTVTVMRNGLFLAQYTITTEHWRTGELSMDLPPLELGDECEVFTGSGGQLQFHIG
jgi:hypothetical protein